jgi:monoamine oxidase
VDIHARKGIGSITLEDWLRSKRASSSTLDLMAIMARVTQVPNPGCPLHALRYVNAAGGLDRMLDVAGARAGPVRRGHPADRREDGRTAECRSGSEGQRHPPRRRRSVTSTTGTVTARAAIVAIPPQHRAGIIFGRNCRPSTSS